MVETTNVFGTKTVENLGNATNAFELFNSGIVKGVPEIDAKVKQIQATFEGMRQGTISLADGQKILGKQLGELDALLVNNIHTNQEKIAVEKESALSMKGSATEMSNAQKVIQGYNADIEASESIFEEFAMAYVEGNYKIIDALGLTDEEIATLMDRFKKDYPEGAVVVEQSGQKIIKSVQDIRKESDVALKDMGKVFEDTAKVIKDNLPPTLAEVGQKIRDLTLEEQYMAEVSQLAAQGVTKDKKLWAAAVMDLAKKYPELNKGTKIVEDLQKATEDQTKAQDKAAKATDEMITIEEKAKQVTDEWKQSMDAIANSFQTFASKGTSTLASVGQKLLDIADKARAASDEFINGEGKRKERKEKFHETMMGLYDEETEAIGNMDVAVARQSHVWQEWSDYGH